MIGLLPNRVGKKSEVRVQAIGSKNGFKTWSSSIPWCLTGKKVHLLMLKWIFIFVFRESYTELKDFTQRNIAIGAEMSK